MSAVTNVSLQLAHLSFSFSILDNQPFELVQHFLKVQHKEYSTSSQAYSSVEEFKFCWKTQNPESSFYSPCFFRSDFTISSVQCNNHLSCQFLSSLTDLHSSKNVSYGKFCVSGAKKSLEQVTVLLFYRSHLQIQESPLS